MPECLHKSQPLVTFELHCTMKGAWSTTHSISHLCLSLCHTRFPLLLRHIPNDLKGGEADTEGSDTVSCSSVALIVVSIRFLFLFPHIYYQNVKCFNCTGSPDSSVSTLCGGWFILLVSTANMASLAPRKSMPDERSSRKVLKLATSANVS